jgi:hypothetical protein
VSIVTIIHSCITSYPKIGDLKQHLLLHNFCGLKSDQKESLSYKIPMKVLTGVAVTSHHYLEKDPLPYVTVGKNQLFTGCCLVAWVPPWLLVGGLPQFLACGPLQREAQNITSCFIKASKEEEREKSFISKSWKLVVITFSSHDTILQIIEKRKSIE